MSTISSGLTRLTRTSGAEADRLVREGLLWRVLLDVVASVDVPDVRRVRAAAARLLLPEAARAAGAAVRGRSAVWVWCGADAAPPSGVLEVGTPPPTPSRCPPGVRFAQARYTPDDLSYGEGGAAPVTSPVRTAADVARVLPSDQALPLLAALRAGTGVGPGQVLARLEDMSRSRGVPAARATLARWSRGLDATV